MGLILQSPERDDVFSERVPDGQLPTEEAMVQIMLDLERTFYTHAMFTEKDGHGQRMLFNVLAAYARYNPHIGFDQLRSFFVWYILC